MQRIVIQINMISLLEDNTRIVNRNKVLSLKQL